MEIDLSRTESLLGPEALRRIAAATVAVVGVGGVGGWCAEALARSGVGRIIVMDDDAVVPSNLNRQCPATVATVGRPKVEAMRERLLSVNPDCEVVPLDCRYPSDRLPLTACDAVVDAIDSVDAKAELILAATAAGVPFVSSMGAALRLDPAKVELRRFDRIEGDGLARALRQRFRRLGRFPDGKFRCACSSEAPRPALAGAKGSYMPVTCAFGMVLAAEVIRLVGNGKGGSV